MEITKEKTVKPYGLWDSPLTPELLSRSTISLHEVIVNESNGHVYWIESRPSEQGRYTILEYDGNHTQEILPAQYSAHAYVNELGGGSIAMSKDGSIIFSDQSTQNVHRLDPSSGEVTVVLKAEKRSTWAVAAKEDHRNATPTTQAYGVRNTLVAIDLLSGTEHTVVEGDDFYSSPCFSNGGDRLCWLQWSHPDMPWTGTRLYVADWKDGQVDNVVYVAGRNEEESITQPRWAPDDSLFFASDRSGYWQLYSYSVATRATQYIHIKGLETADFAIAAWRLATSTYFFLDADMIVASCVTNATSDIVLLDLTTRSYRSLELPFLDLALTGTGLFRVSNDSFTVLGSTRTTSKRLVLVSRVHSTTLVQTTLQSTTKTTLDAGFFSTAQHIEVPRTSRDGIIHLLYFPPQHPDFTGPADTAPPGLIQLHGGPNGCTSPALEMSIQFWTSRGFVVCAVNYAGSTGFGRKYREELTGHWGLYDVQDTHDAATYLGEHNLFDRTRVGIFGGSAGGYGTLSAIHMYPSSFAAAVSSYGISDVQALQADSYKFESHDVERLILSSCARDDEEGRTRLFHQRSPRYHATNITAPLLLLQGSIDVAVPPEQSHMMVEQMRQHGRTVEIVVFEGEGHGWLKESSIRRAYEEQERWWRRHLCGVSL